ncbi:MAG: LemA family protein [Propionibacteriaceae bacterium]|jgi:LemA protein|nr:LemA family protein [Propionibacteriaceae bacterium]
MSSALGIALIILGVVIVCVGIAAFAAIAQYNGLVKARNLNEESWRQVDVELNRRYDLIPNLVETVDGYARHERGTLENVVALRNQAAALASGGASRERAAAEQQLSGAIHNLLVSVEAYPALQANSNFRDLQQQLTATEDRIANARRYYNANVRAYNDRVETFPSSFVAGFGHFARATYFEVEDAAVRQTPRVDFSSLGESPQSLPADSAASSAAAGSHSWQSPNYAVRSGSVHDDRQKTDQFGRPLPAADASYAAPLDAAPYSPAPLEASPYGSAGLDPVPYGSPSLAPRGYETGPLTPPAAAYGASPLDSPGDQSAEPPGYNAPGGGRAPSF